MTAILEGSKNGYTAEGIRDGIVSDVTRFVGSAEQHDDITVVVLRAL